jgi:hypothetical protein
MAINNPSQEKMHYDSLISLLKYALGATTLLAGVITFMIGTSLTEIKRNISDDIKESAKKLESVKSDADKAVADTKADAKDVLQYTRDLTNMQIKILKEDASKLAALSAENRIDNFFKNNKIQDLVDTTTRREVGKVAKDEISKTKIVLNDLSNLTIAYQKVSQQGSRWYLDYIDNLSNKAQDNLTREFAKSLLLQSGREYENNVFHTQYYQENSPENIKAFFRPSMSLVDGESLDTSRNKVIQKFSLPENASNDKILEELFLNISDAKRESSLTELTVMYWHIRKLTGIQFKNFDSKPVIDWYYSKYGVKIKNQ